VPIIQRSH